jgi:hypothetical protein
MFDRMRNDWAQMSTFAKLWRTFALIAIGLVLLAASPLVFRTRVDEAFPVAASASNQIATATTAEPSTSSTMAEPTTGTDSDMVAAPTASTASETMAEPTAVPSASDAMAEPTVVPSASDAMAEPTAEMLSEIVAEPTTAPIATSNEPVALSQGEFTRVDVLHAAFGNAVIYRLPDGAHVLRLEEFSTTNGPDLYIGLSGHPMPRSNSELHESGYVELERLKGSEGSQNYALPADLDLNQFKSVVIYCKAFSVVFSTAELMETAL